MCRWKDEGNWACGKWCSLLFFHISLILSTLASITFLMLSYIRLVLFLTLYNSTCFMHTYLTYITYLSYNNSMLLIYMLMIYTITCVSYVLFLFITLLAISVQYFKYRLRFVSSVMIDAVFSLHTSMSNTCSMLNLIWAWIGHSNSTWGIVSLTPGWQRQDGFSLHLNRCKYSENPPCSVSTCVSMLSVLIFLTILWDCIASRKKIFVIDCRGGVRLVEELPKIWLSFTMSDAYSTIG